VIEDFDGPDPTPNHRRHMLVASLLLIASVIVGYAAVSSPELRGPFATPHPSSRPVVNERASASLNPVVLYVRPMTAASLASCMIGQNQQSRTGYGFVGGRSVTLVRELNVNVWLSGGSCQPEVMSPAWPFAP
jgi:hypothetical protein